MIKERLVKIIPFTIILGIVIAFGRPYFFENKVPYPSKYQVNFFPPWSSYQKYWGPVKNNAMPDVIDQLFPWKNFTVQTIKQGQIPFWNPYNFSGNPHLANYQSAVLSPFNILFFVIPFIDAWSIIVLIQPFLAGVFTYLFLRAIKTSVVGSLIASISYMFCGSMVVWMAYGTISMTAAILPLILFATEKYLNTRRFLFFILFGLSIALVIFSGHFQTALYVILLSFSYLIFRGVMAKNTRALIFLLVCFFLGIIISLPQLFLSIQFYLSSVRSEIFITGGGIPFWYLPTIVAPDFFGNPVTRNDWAGYYAEWASFVGIIPFIFATISFFTRPSFHKVFFAVSAIATLLLALDTPLQVVLGNMKIPVLSTSNPNRVVILFSFSLSILAAMGIDLAWFRVKEKKFREVFISLIIVSLFLLVVWYIVLILKPIPADKLLIAQRNFILPTVFYFATVLLLLALRFIQWKKFPLVVFSFFFIITLIDSFRFAIKWMPFDPRELAFPDVAVIKYIKENIGYGRIYGNLGTEVNSYYGISSIEGYDPLYIGRYGDFVRSASDGTFREGERSVVKLDRRGKYTDRVIDLLGVNLIFHPVADTNADWAYPVWKDRKKYTSLYDDGLFAVYKNNTALSRVRLYYDYEVIPLKEDVIKRFYNNDFDFRTKLILEEKLQIVLNKSQGSGIAKIISYTPNRVMIKVSTAEPALLFLSDNYYPGWKVLVNGKKEKIYRADYSFRAVVVHQGESNVEFFYSPI